VETTAVGAGALTVAGQRRIYTVFPSILANVLLVSVVSSGRPDHVIKPSSMTSTVDMVWGGQVKGPETLAQCSTESAAVQRAGVLYQQRTATLPAAAESISDRAIGFYF
jgi:hypothetical protein